MLVSALASLFCSSVPAAERLTEKKAEGICCNSKAWAFTNCWSARECLDEFLKQTGLSPNKSDIFAGALLYRRYGFFKRLLMKWIVSRKGGDTDTSRDYEYTDWDQVTEFTQQFLYDVESGDNIRSGGVLVDV